MPTFMKKLSVSADIKVGFNYFHSFCNGLNNPVMLQSYNASKILRGASCQEKHFIRMWQQTF